MNMEKMKEKGKKKEPLRNSYELDLLTIFFRIGLDFFSDSAIIRIQNPYIQAAARWRGREVCEKMKNKSMSILKMTGAAAVSYTHLPDQGVWRRGVFRRDIYGNRTVSGTEDGIAAGGEKENRPVCGGTYPAG